MYRNKISISDLFNKVDYLQTPISANKIVMKERHDAEIGFYMIDKNQVETLVGIVSEDDEVIVTNNGIIQIGGLFFTGFRIELVTFENSELESVKGQ